MTKTNIFERKKKLEQRENKLKQLKASLSLQERKARTRHLIELGGLIVKAGLEEWKTNTLLGAFLSVKDKEKDSKQIEAWSHRGGAEFSKESSNKSAVIIRFHEKPSEDTRSQLKTSGLKWNALRQEWEGHVHIEKLKSLLSSTKADIRELES